MEEEDNLKTTPPIVWKLGYIPPSCSTMLTETAKKAIEAFVFSGSSIPSDIELSKEEQDYYHTLFLKYD